MAVDGAALLREAGHIDRAAALAFEMRRHAENGADRDDARAADAGNQNAVGLRRRFPRITGRGSGREIVVPLASTLGLPSAGRHAP